MRIDYGRPVTRIVEIGWYLGIFTGPSSGYGTHGQIIFVEYKKGTAIRNYRRLGWQFYRVRLPRLRKGAK